MRVWHGCRLGGRGEGPDHGAAWEGMCNIRSVKSTAAAEDLGGVKDVGPANWEDNSAAWEGEGTAGGEGDIAAWEDEVADRRGK